jgi:hypothetical protein
VGKSLIIVGFALCFLVSCAQQKSVEREASAGVMPPPKEKEVMKPGEKVNTMMLMQAENAAEEMDEVIVIPPKDKKNPPK